MRSMKTGDGKPECNDERDEDLSMLAAVVNSKNNFKSQVILNEISLLSFQFL